MSKDSRQRLFDNLRDSGGKVVPTSSLRRLQKTATIATRMGVGAVVGRLRGEEFSLAGLSPEAVAKIVESLGELKGVAMKVGQLLSYVDGTLPAEARQLLSVLQVMSQPTALSQIQTILAEDLGAGKRSLIARLEPLPVASASIGQVHRATRSNGVAVAVKVRHPGIEDAIHADFKSAAIAGIFARLAAPGVNIDDFLIEAETRFLEECDYGLEAKRQAQFRAFFVDDPAISIPEVHPDLCGPRVLTSTWHEGLALDAFLDTATFAAERIRASRALYEFYAGTLYRHGLFNADPHPGNLLFAPEGRVTVLDHGCVRQFDRDTVTWLARLSRSVRGENAGEIKESLSALGMSNPSLDFDVTRSILRAFYAPLMYPGRHAVEPEQAISLRQVTKLRRDLLRMRLPGKFMFLFRIRLGLYAVLAHIGAKLDWIALEEELSETARA